jgi:hypothetical protein
MAGGKGGQRLAIGFELAGSGDGLPSSRRQIIRSLFFSVEGRMCRCFVAVLADQDIGVAVTSAADR